MGLPRNESGRPLSSESTSSGEASGLGAVPLASESDLSSRYSSEDDLSSVGRTDCSEDETEYAVPEKDRRADPMRRQDGKPGTLLIALQWMNRLEKDQIDSAESRIG